VPTTVSGMRVARSFVSPTGAANTVERELDFQLGSDDGIQIEGVLGYGHYFDASPAPSDTVPLGQLAHQTLHLETGATEALPDDAGDDADDIDTEIFYVQAYSLVWIQGSTVTYGAGGSLTITPSGMWVPPEPILSPRNIIHKGTSDVADSFLNCGVLIYYRYVRFTTSELGTILARTG